ncbi:MAG: Hint domain-containing protein [Pseudorhodobacter sp.]
MPIFALYNFDDTSTTAADSAVENGAQDGIYLDGATAVDGRAVLDGIDDKVKIYPDPTFQLPRGTLEIQFSQTAHQGEGANTILSRDTASETPGGFRIEVLADGSVLISHESAASTTIFQTEPGFLNPGDEVNVTYSWDAANGGTAQISNLTTGDTFEAAVPAGLTMDQGPISQPWIIGAGQSNSDADALNNIDQYFQGSVEYFSLSDTVDNGAQDPVANPDTAETDEDVAVVIDVLENDTDPQDDPLTIVGTPTAENGTVTLNPDGTITYTPDPDWNGTDTITYTVTDPGGNTASSTVTVVVNPVNDAPVANDDTATTPLNTAVVIPVLANDTDVDGDILSISGDPVVVGGAAVGTIAVNPDGTITFTPATGFVGEATITYVVTDPGGLTDDATVLVTVSPSERDGIVRGTDGPDLIDGSYVDPFDGDRIDAGDAIIGTDGPNDDRVVAGAGDDTVFAGLGDDTVFGGTGNDLIYGGPGNDELFGGEGNDTIFGGDGNDTIYGGPGVTEQYGGADRDLFIVNDVAGGPGTFIDGGEEGDDYDTLDLRGAGPLRVTFDDDNIENGVVDFLDADGNSTGQLRFVNIESVTPCFTPGTLIATPKGEVPVESLRPGDRVVTRDNGIQEIRWTGTKAMDWGALTANPHLRPVMIRQGSLGNGLPERDMMVSPNHRVLVANDRTALYFDEHEVLVAAKHLVGARGIFEVESVGTSYIHFMFDQHEVVLSDGAWTESFQPGDYTLKGMGNAQRNEIFELFPELKTVEGLENYMAARRTLKKHEARLLTR